MTPDSPSSPLRHASRRWWLGLAGLLLAFNAVTALPEAPRHDTAELRSAALSTPTPVHAQFRDPAAIKAAQRSIKAQDHRDGDPPLILHHAALIAAPRGAAAPFVIPAPSASVTGRPARPYQARAPPPSA